MSQNSSSEFTQFLPGGKRLVGKWRNVGSVSQWKEFGSTPDTAIAAVDKELLGLNKVTGKSVKKLEKEGFHNNLQKRISFLEGIKQQALQAISYVDYDLGLILPKVTKHFSNPEFGAGNFG